MSENAPQTPSELPPIDFVSPGRFPIHNPEPAPAEPVPCEPAPFELGGDRELQHLARAKDFPPHALALLQQARRSLCLYSPDLEPWLYDHPSVQRACSRFLLAHPRNRLRILLHDAERVVREGHRLLQLVRRLSSNAEIRLVDPEQPHEDGSYLIADHCGLLRRPRTGYYTGSVCYQEPARARQLQAQFDRAWEHGQASADLRSFLL